MGTQTLLEYYKRELTFLRRMGMEFAEQYPKVAERLELNVDQCPDPHIERLIESFAFLTGRIQYRIESELPNLTTALLGNLYPQFLNPVPSMAIACFQADLDHGKLTSMHTIEKETPLFTKTEQGDTCRFRTCYPVHLWPLKVTYAGFESPDRFDFLDNAPDVSNVLRIRIETTGPKIADIGPESLRFYLNGDWSLATSLYELLFCRVSRLVLKSGRSKRRVSLPKESILPVGFETGEGVLPFPANAHIGYRLIQEYFTFPEKFLFFDINGLDTSQADDFLDILVIINSMPKGRLVIDKSTFCLGCTPIVNLFTKITEPIRFDHKRAEYRIIPDKRREKTTEIHSIISVSGVSDLENRAKSIENYFAFNHSAEKQGQKVFWIGRHEDTGRRDLPGTDIFLSFIDTDFNPKIPAANTVYARTLCTNRYLAAEVPAGAILEMEEAAPLAIIYTLGKPTPQINPPLKGAALWRLISHLSLNYLSLGNTDESLKALKELLKLYSFSEHIYNQHQIASITGMSCREVVRRTGVDAWRGFCRGTEITLTFDDLLGGANAFLLGAVLNRFFPLYTSINSFTQLMIKKRQYEEEVWKRWEPVAGEQMIL